LAARPTPSGWAKKDVEGVFIVGTDNKVIFRPMHRLPARSTSRSSPAQEGERIVGGTQAIRELKDGTLVREPKKDDKKPQVTKS
jgi:hypothetical protein